MFSRLLALGTGALLLAASSVNAATLTLAGTAKITSNTETSITNGVRLLNWASEPLVRFTVTWDSPPADPSTITLACSSPDYTFPDSYLINPNNGDAQWSSFPYSGTQASGDYAPYWKVPYPTAQGINRATNGLVTCTAACTGMTSASLNFYTGSVIEVTSDVTGNAVAGTAYTLTTTETPNNAIALVDGGSTDTVFQVSCGTGGGTLSATTQTWNAATEATAHTVTWTAPAAPKTPITCTWLGPTPLDPAANFQQYMSYNMSATFTMAIPTITVAAFGGTVTTGTNTNLLVTLSEQATALQLTATCMSGGSTVATVVGTISGTSNINFPFGATLTQAASAVTCTLARTGGDVKWTNSAVSNTIGPFTIVLGASTASSTANNAAVSSTANTVASSGMGGASSSTGPSGCVGPTCAAPASLQAGVAMFVLAAAAIMALMQ